jgi:hypothetical protein
MPIKNSSSSKDTATSSPVVNCSSTPEEEIDSPNGKLIRPPPILLLTPAAVVPQKELNKASRHDSNSQPETRAENQTDTAVQTDGEAPNGAQNTKKTRYADDETQTDKNQSEAAPVRPNKKAFVEDHAPVTTGRRKTFPMTSSKFTNTCKPTAVRRAEDRTTQTDVVHEQPKAIQPPMAQEKVELKPALKQVHRIRTFPMTTAPLGSLPPFRPFRASMALRSPHRTIDEGKTEGVRDRGESSERTKQPLSREAPIVPVLPKSHPEPNPVRFQIYL